MSTRRKAAKGATLTAGAALVTYGVEMALAGQTVVGAVGGVFGLVLFVVYVAADEIDQQARVDEIVNTIGEDTLRELSNAAATRIREALEPPDRE